MKPTIIAALVLTAIVIGLGIWLMKRLKKSRVTARRMAIFRAFEDLADSREIRGPSWTLDQISAQVYIIGMPFDRALFDQLVEGHYISAQTINGVIHYSRGPNWS